MIVAIYYPRSGHVIEVHQDGDYRGVIKTRDGFIVHETPRHDSKPKVMESARAWIYEVHGRQVAHA